MNLFYKNNFIVIDESFSGADSINIHKFSNILNSIKKEYDMCILHPFTKKWHTKCPIFSYHKCNCTQ